MEYTLGEDAAKAAAINAAQVLILVLMEYTLGVRNLETIILWKQRLNPCSNGIYSRRGDFTAWWDYSYQGLNPCSNGIYSRSPALSFLCVQMKGGLNPCSNGIYSRRFAQPGLVYKAGLNPCSNGIYSRRMVSKAMVVEVHQS